MLLDIDCENRRYYFLHIELKVTHEQVGSIGYTVVDDTPVGKIVHPGYFAYPKFWGNGYTSEALKKLLEFAFTENNVYRVTAGCNIVSGENLKIPNINHNVYDKNYRHEVDVVKNTLLYSLFNEDKLKVSSLHTWYLEEAEALKNSRIIINATIEDKTLDSKVCKTVECYTINDTRFAMGIKWHPEYMEEEHFQKIFSAFFEACRK